VTWKNWRNTDGVPVQIPVAGKSGITDEDLKKIPPALMTELANAITEQARLTDEEMLGLEL
jgi:CRISPR/Cas system type I-B associated protein Csh2 (Cas7 group RAMP superfamily)